MPWKIFWSDTSSTIALAFSFSFFFPSTSKAQELQNKPQLYLSTCEQLATLQIGKSYRTLAPILKI